MPKVVSNLHTTPQNAQINQSENYSGSVQTHSKNCEKIPIVLQQKGLASDATSKKPSNVFHTVNKNNYSLKDFSESGETEETLCTSGASNYLSSIGRMNKQPIKVSS